MTSSDRNKNAFEKNAISHTQATKWNNHYQRSNSPGTVSPILSQYTQLIPKQGRALDLACGLGANALFLAALGLETHAWDISSVALEHLLQFALKKHVAITTLTRDIENDPPPKESFDIIVVTHFLYRPICQAISEALRPNGILFYQTFLSDKTDQVGPTSPKFLLNKNELLSLFPDLTVLAYQEIGSYPQRTSTSHNQPPLPLFDGNTAMLVAQKLM